MFLNASNVECNITKDGKSRQCKISTNVVDNMVFHIPNGRYNSIQIKLKFENVTVPTLVALSLNQYLKDWLDFKYILKDKNHKVYLNEKFDTLLTKLYLRKDTDEIILEAKNVSIPKDTNMHLFTNYIKY